MNFFKQEDPEIAAKIKAATKVSMDEASRERTRALLSEYVKMRPIRADVHVENAAISKRLSTFFTRHSMPAFAAVLVLAVGGGTAAAAEGALPGDVLYPIKVHVSEEVRATLAVSSKAKADWAVDRAERRLEEAATLALSGKLDDATRAELDTNLDAHVESAGESREQLENADDPDASEIRMKIGAVLIARENILDGVRGTKGVARATAVAIRTMGVRVETQSVQKDEKAGEAEELETLTRGHRTAAKARIEATKKFLGSPHRLGTSTREQAEIRLKTAAEDLSSGDADVSEGNKVEASSHFDSALETATEIETIISVSSDSGESESEHDLGL